MPTDATRRQVESLASFGTPRATISKVLGLSENTLNKHYRPLILAAEPKANAMVADSLFAMAVGRAAEYDANGRKIRSEQKRIPIAAIFWAKTRMRWSEKSPVGEKDDTLKIIVEGGLPARLDHPDDAPKKLDAPEEPAEDDA